MYHGGFVVAVAISLDGHLLASGGADGLLRIWEPATGREVSRVDYHGELWAASFSPDNRWIAAGGYEEGESYVRVFPVQASDLISLACARLKRNLTYEEWQQHITNEPYRRTCPNLPAPTIEASGGHPVISSDGRYIAFVSGASNLVCDDTNFSSDVFVYDRQTDQISRISVSADGRQADGDSYAPDMSADGRYVVFTSDADNLVDEDTNDGSDVFVHDRLTGQTTRVSIASSGEQANSGSSEAQLSDDGHYVVFSSSATNLVGGDSNEAEDIFIHDQETGQTVLVSRTANDVRASDDCFGPSVSASGRYVAFLSWATSLATVGCSSETVNFYLFDRIREHLSCVAVDAYFTLGAFGDESYLAGIQVFEGEGILGEYELAQVFIYNLETGQVTSAPIGSDGVLGNRDSDWPSITSDGRYLVFASEATNLLESGRDTNEAWDIFVTDLRTSRSERVSVASDGTQSNGNSLRPAISDDGRYVAFESSFCRESPTCD
jgi:Tol biopolymer transport system component